VGPSKCCITPLENISAKPSPPKPYCGERASNKFQHSGESERYVSYRDLLTIDRSVEARALSLCPPIIYKTLSSSSSSSSAAAAADVQCQRGRQPPSTSVSQSVSQSVATLRWLRARHDSRRYGKLFDTRQSVGGYQ
jgi:hypothetical protein